MRFDGRCGAPNGSSHGRGCCCTSFILKAIAQWRCPSDLSVAEYIAQSKLSAAQSNPFAAEACTETIHRCGTSKVSLFPVRFRNCNHGTSTGRCSAVTACQSCITLPVGVLKTRTVPGLFVLEVSPKGGGVGCSFASCLPCVSRIASHGSRLPNRRR